MGREGCPHLGQFGIVDSMVGDLISEALAEKDYSAKRYEEYAKTLIEGIENMRKLVYAFYDQNFSFRKLTDIDPALAGDVTDCLSGDVNKDFTPLWNKIREFVPLPEDVLVGSPLAGSKMELTTDGHG